MPNPNIDDLRPQARVRCIAWLSACNDLYLPIQFPGFRVRVTDTKRTLEQQAADQAAGVSELKVGWHNYGLAWDYAIYDASGNWITRGDHPAYAVCGQASLALGCHYPIILSTQKPDADHIEYHPGVTLAQMTAADAASPSLFA